MSKQRLSFVTNSSSSSFILAVKDEGFLKSGTSKLEKFVKGIIFGNAEVIKTKEELDEYFKANYVYGTRTLEKYLADDEYGREDYEKYLQYINNGYLVVKREVDNSEDTMIDLIHELPNEDKIIMIQGEY